MEDSIAIVFQDRLNDTVTQPARAVIEHQMWTVR